MLHATTSHRSLSLTSEGRLVLGPKFCRPGDVVRIFYGGDVPFILRRSADKCKEDFLVVEETYQLVEEAYVDGLWKGRDTRVE